MASSMGENSVLPLGAQWSAADPKNSPEYVIFPSDDDFRITQNLSTPMAKDSQDTLDSFPCDIAFRVPTHSTLSKPAIVIENADPIQIHIPDSEESLMNSIQSTATDSSTADDSHVESPYTGSSPIAIKNRSVRFRSRVRITSGLPRRRAADRITPDSSLSSSPSSSISAPLRCREHDVNTDSSPWSPLGQRVKQMSQGPRARQRQVAANGFDPDERSPLMIPSRRFYSIEEDEHYNYFAYLDDETRLNREIDLAFGTWPGRLLNRHWWWWHLEPLEEEEQW
ncbi:uncharacterized protein EV420DRAFT_1570824 [Desarmillaria tabescens]|uniref:Uncharacterized protein n=1 Tax=Armillaria tabescens TaxID=1929756 RepID=A0AA39JPE3_ARMTA|nr:uncharacterized protein EV420DRAFT_1570824 [Desarmillaria tabescens]KAK0446485.1 hypothetical protein EV420DRAFT_1570824 [Desarmillaria tabescens]